MWYTCSLFSDTCKHKVNNNINYNTGNLTFCVYAYTDEQNDLHI